FTLVPANSSQNRLLFSASLATSGNSSLVIIGCVTEWAPTLKKHDARVTSSTVIGRSSLMSPAGRKRSTIASTTSSIWSNCIEVSTVQILDTSSARTSELSRSCSLARRKDSASFKLTLIVEKFSGLFVAVKTAFINSSHQNDRRPTKPLHRKSVAGASNSCKIGAARERLLAYPSSKVTTNELGRNLPLFRRSASSWMDIIR